MNNVRNMNAITLRRAFVDTPAGQIHLRIAGDPAMERTPLMCLHQSPASSLTYAEVLPCLGDDRLAFAVDTPGFGESFRPQAQPRIEDYGGWLSAVPDALGIERFDVLGIFTGAAVATAIALQNPERVRRVVLVGPPVFTPAQREAFVQNAWPARPNADGSYLAQEWSRVMTRYPEDVPFLKKVEAFHEFYRGGANAIWGEIAVAMHDLGEQLVKLKQPVLILQPDDVFGRSDEAHALVAHSELVRLPGMRGLGLFQLYPEKIASIVKRFLDNV